MMPELKGIHCFLCGLSSVNRRAYFVDCTLTRIVCFALPYAILIACAIVTAYIIAFMTAALLLVYADHNRGRSQKYIFSLRVGQCVEHIRLSEFTYIIFYPNECSLVEMFEMQMSGKRINCCSWKNALHSV